MDIATISVLGGLMTVMTTVIVTVMLHLDRSRRADIATLSAISDKRFEQTEQRFDQMERRFELIERRSDSRFEQIETRFELMEKRFEQIDLRFDQIERRFEWVQDQFRLIHKQFERIDKRLDKFMGIVINLANDVGEIKGRLAVAMPVEALSAVE